MANVAKNNRVQPSDSAVPVPDLENVHFYEEVEQAPEFKELERSKARFIVPATIFFMIYYFLLPVLVGYFPQFMDTRVLGSVNIAYLFALSQFFMAWIIAFMYLNKASKVYDVLIAKIVNQATRLRQKRGV